MFQLLLLANIEGIVDLEVDRVALGLLGFLLLQVLDHTLGVIRFRVEEESHVVDCF